MEPCKKKRVSRNSNNSIQRLTCRSGNVIHHSRTTCTHHNHHTGDHTKDDEGEVASGEGGADADDADDEMGQDVRQLTSEPVDEVGEQQFGDETADLVEHLSEVREVASLADEVPLHTATRAGHLQALTFQLYGYSVEQPSVVTPNYTSLTYQPVLQSCSIHRCRTPTR